MFKMRKLFVLLIIFVILLNVHATINGDINNDNKVSALDYVIVRKHLLRTELMTGDILKRADVNNDNKISSLDYVAIRIIVLNDINIKTKSLDLEVGEEKNIEYSVNNNSYVEVSFSSNNTKVATVDASGKVKGIAKGEAIITATMSNGKTVTCNVKVTPISVQSVSLDRTSLSLEQGEKVTLKAIITPSNATNKEVIWTSSDSSVATVDQNGVVQVIKNGTAEVTVTTKDGNKKATCNVSLNISDLTNIYEIVPTKACAINVNVNNDIRVMQGVSFYQSNNKSYAVYAGFKSDVDPTIITLVDLNECLVVDKNNSVVMGHANDITYSDADNKFYVVNVKKIHSFSIKNDKEIIVDSQPIIAKNTMSGIAYDKDKKQYYWKAGTVLGTISSLNSSYVKIRNVPTYYSNIENGNVKTVDQAIAYAKVDGHRNIYYARTISDTNAKVYYNHTFISVFDADTGKYKYTMHFGGKDGKTLPSGHLEGISIIDNTIYFGLNIHFTNPKQVIFYKYTGLKEMENNYN